MRTLLSKEVMKRCDQNTIEGYGVPSCVLMERAALACVEELYKSHAALDRVLVVCGSGNNGGDGFAIARLLFQDEIPVSVCFVGKEDSCTEQTRRQKEICKKYGITFCSNPRINEYTVIVDALFGIGLSRDIEGRQKDWIVRINESQAFVLSVDIPSGIDGNTGVVRGIAVRADLTVTFAFAQPGHYIGKGRAYTGKVVVRQIGITKESIPKCRENYFCYDKEDFLRLPERLATENKGSCGKVLLIAGSRDMCGAAILSARAAYRSGAGYVRVYTEASNRPVLFSSVPEAVVSCITEDWESELADLLAWADVVAAGPGIGMEQQKSDILSYVLEHADIPVILDADALNLVSAHALLRPDHIMPLAVTPHPGEMARLCGSSLSDIMQDLAGCAKTFAQKQRVVCVLKDSGTVVSNGREAYINVSGNSGMATAGSGDVLTGIFAGLTAQGMELFEAAKLAVFLHGCAGDRAAQQYGERSMTAWNLTESICLVLADADKNRKTHFCNKEGLENNEQ